jgi:hypothetical protein
MRHENPRSGRERLLLRVLFELLRAGVAIDVALVRNQAHTAHLPLRRRSYCAEMCMGPACDTICADLLWIARLPFLFNGVCLRFRDLLNAVWIIRQYSLEPAMVTRVDRAVFRNEALQSTVT